MPALVRCQGFYAPISQSTRELMSDDFVFMGPVVGPLNTQDYLGTLGVFKICAKHSVYDYLPAA